MSIYEQYTALKFEASIHQVIFNRLLTSRPDPNTRYLQITNFIILPNPKPQNYPLTAALHWGTDLAIRCNLIVSKLILCMMGIVLVWVSVWDVKCGFLQG